MGDHLAAKIINRVWEGAARSLGRGAMAVSPWSRLGPCSRNWTAQLETIETVNLPAVVTRWRYGVQIRRPSGEGPE